MTKTIEVPDSLYRELEKRARPFEDKSPADVIRRIMSQPVSNEKLRILSPDDPEDLTHTKVLSGRFGSVTSVGSWNELLTVAHEVALEEIGSFETLKSYTEANIKKGKDTSSGYRYSDDADISIQGYPANYAWRHALQLARNLGVEIEVEFKWRPKQEAKYPGRRGKLSWEPAPSR